MFRTTYASYVTRMDTCQRNVLIGSIIKEDLVKEKDLILGLPWIEKHNPIIDWKEKTLEFRSSSEDKAKAFIWNLA